MSRRILLIAGIALVVCAGAVAGWRALRHGDSSSSAGASASAKAAKSADYYCPMHPTYRSDRPGDCPICNMRLVKAEAVSPPAKSEGLHGTAHEGSHEMMHEGAHAAVDDQAVQKAAEQAKQICYLHNCEKLHNGVPCPMTVVATPGETVTCPVCGTYVVKADGTLAPGTSQLDAVRVPLHEESHHESNASVAAPAGYAPVLLTPQRLQLIGVKTEPARVRRLTKTVRTVGRIAYDPQLYQAQQEYLSALEASERAGRGSIPEVAAQAGRLVESSRMRLRLSGLGQELINELAERRKPDSSLLLADPDGRVWLYATIYEYELPLVSVGQTVRVDVPAMPGRTFEGVIRSIDPVLDPQTRSARLRAVLTDPDGALKPEMYVNVSIQIDAGDVLAVPQDAVFDTGTQKIVFVDKGRGLFEPRDVVAGVTAEGFTQITQGVAAGEPVVTSGNFLIDSESRLKGALEGLGGGQQPEGSHAGGHQHGQ